MRRTMVLVMMILAMIAFGVPSVAAGPRADALAAMGITFTLPTSLDDAPLQSENGCVGLQADNDLLVICRLPDTHLDTVGAMLSFSSIWQQYIYEKTAIDPSVSMPTQTVVSIKDLTTTTQTGILGALSTVTFATNDFGSQTLVSTFVAAAPNGDAVGIAFLRSSAYQETPGEFALAVDHLLLI